MKVKVPNKIKIGVNTYNVEYLPDELFNDNEFGACWHRKELITIDPSSKETQKYTTFLHETIHLVEKSYSFKISESEVDMIAHGMVELLRDNIGIELDWSDIREAGMSVNNQ